MRRLAFILALTASCGGDAAPVANPSPSAPPDVTGLITEVRFEGDEVVSFVVEDRSATYDLLIDPQFDYGFNLRHLEKHRVDELPVFVQIVSRDGELYAHEVLDA